MPLRDDLLNPIPGPDPSGASLRYEKVYDQIKEARTEDDESLPSGDWQRQVKKADFQLVIKLAGEALATKSKDLQLVAWLTEAHIKREGISLIEPCFRLMLDLQEQFWDTIYPEIEEGDAGLRATPIEWAANRTAALAREAPITKKGLNYFQYKESRAVGYEADAEMHDSKREARQVAITDGKVTAEDFDAAFAATPKAYYVGLHDSLQSTLATIETLQEFCEQKYGDHGPSFGKMRTSIEEVDQVVNSLLNEKRKLEPDPLAEEEVGEEQAGQEVGAKMGGTEYAAGWRPQKVDFTLTAPAVVTPGVPFELFIWAHETWERSRVLARAREELSVRDLLARTKGPFRISAGTVLTVRLRILGAEINEPEDTMEWEGESTCVSFVVTLPELSREAKCYGSAHVYASGVQVAKIPFLLSSSGGAGMTATAGVRYRTAFASYASDDRDAVLGRIQGIHKVAPELEVFLDVLSLRSGQNWEKELWRVIPASDIFYLFWSTHARKSEWVEKEWRCALRERGIEFIDPIPLESPKKSPPPPELSSLHFNDWELAFRGWRS